MPPSFLVQHAAAEQRSTPIQMAEAELQLSRGSFGAVSVPSVLVQQVAAEHHRPIDGGFATRSLPVQMVEVAGTQRPSFVQRSSSQPMLAPKTGTPTPPRTPPTPSHGAAVNEAKLWHSMARTGPWPSRQ